MAEHQTLFNGKIYMTYQTTTSFEDDDVPIETLDLAVRSYSCLKRNNIATVKQLLTMQRNDLLTIRNFHRANYEEVRDRLIQRNFMTAARPIGPFVEYTEEQDDSQFE
jgi:DNA-directed RNA polymerase alpha subunit